jgi:DNA-directed RNA polymerase subunit omega
MSRVTVDDCLAQIPSRFELTLVASKRARQLTRGAEARLPWHDHKSTVLALREIAEGLVTSEVLKEMDLPVPAPVTPVLDPLDAYFDR